MHHPKLCFIAISVLVWIAASTDAWMFPNVPSQTRMSPTTSFIRSNNNHRISSTSLNGWLDGLSPYDSKIPEELKEEIYRAEANTPAAKERGQRVAFLALFALIGILFAFFNGFLTELRAGGGPDGSPGLDLADSSFAWVLSNPVSSFLFTNGIGGGLCLLLGAGAGLLAEAELDSKRINAEKIYEELERRRNDRTKPAISKKKKKMEKAKNKKRRSGKAQKRLGALSEVLAVENTKEEEETAAAVATETDMASDGDSTATVSEADVTKEESSNTGLMGGIEDLYKQADTMAASQALLLNKQLEEAGVVDKITDETGLKVIGKEAADKLKEKPEEEGKQAEKQ